MLATDTDEPVDYVMPVKALPKAPVEEVSANDGNSRTGLPKPAGAACKAAVVALLRDAVAQGPSLSAKSSASSSLPASSTREAAGQNELQVHEPAILNIGPSCDVEPVAGHAETRRHGPPQCTH